MPQERIPRRKFLKLLPIPLVIPALRILDTELRLFSGNDNVDNKRLAEQANKWKIRRKFGIYPDFDGSNDDAWNTTNRIKTTVGQTDMIGFFANFDPLHSQEGQSALLIQLEKIAKMNATPVISIGNNSRPNSTHIFSKSKSNETTIKHWGQELAAILKAFSSPVIIRPFFEMNLSNVFEYGLGKGINSSEHIRGFRNAFRILQREITQHYGGVVDLSFSPSGHSEFVEYFPDEATSAGIDIYDLFPGSWQILNPHYWEGNISAENMLRRSLTNLAKLTNYQIPFGFWELGSITRRADWLEQAVLLLFAVGGSFVMHFNYDKSYKNEPHEGDWRINDSIASMYARVFAAVNI